MTEKDIVVSIGVNLHSEGITAKPTIRSVMRAAFELAKKGVIYEIILIIDKGDEETDLFAKEMQEFFTNTEHQWSIPSSRFSIIHTEHGDLGLARNSGVKAAKGQYINFIDGDNIVDRFWFIKAYEFISSLQDQNVILHPQVYFSYGDDSITWVQEDLHSLSTPIPAIVHQNFWDAMCFTTKEVFKNYPYAPTSSLKSNFGYEDWHWNCETVAAGVRHLAVPKTLYHYKKAYNNSSMAWSYASTRSVIPRSKLFDKETFSSLTAKSWKLNKQNMSLSFEEYRIKYERKVKTILQSDFIREAWEDIRDFDKRIENLQSRPIYSANRERDLLIGNTYLGLISAIDASYDVVLIGPRLHIGGADKVLRNYANAINEGFPESKVLLVITEHSETITAKLSKDVDVLEFGNITVDLTEEEKLLLLVRITLQTMPSVVHVVHSHLGFEMIKHYKNIIRSFADISATSFTFAKKEDGGYFSYGTKYFIDSRKDIIAFTSDNSKFLQELHDSYGLPNNQLYTHYQPEVDNTRFARVKNDTDSFNVLWAGRMDKEKHPEYLIPIAEKLTNNGRNVVFHVYGELVLNPESDIINRLIHADNIVYGGKFSNFYDLPIEDMDLFLLTTEYEGLPNILIEALNAKFPVIAPDVGGISEIITADTGILLPEYDNIDQYVEAIELLMNDPEKRRSFGGAGYKLIRKRHSPKHFIEQIRKFPGYASLLKKSAK